MPAMVDSLRSHFNQTYADNVASGVYDRRDVDRLMTSDQYAQAFLRHQKGVAKNAADMCHRSFKWRKEVGLNDLTDASFPEELLKKGAIFFRNVDKDDNPIILFKIKEHKKNPAHLPIIQKYMVYLLDQEDKRIEGRQVVVLFDMTGAGLGNLDLDLIRFLITCFEEYMPDYLAYLLVFDMPWILNTAWKIIKAWLSEEARQKVIFVRGQEVLQYVDRDNLLVHMGGLDDYTFKYEPLMNGHDNHNTADYTGANNTGNIGINVNQNHVTADIHPVSVSDERKHVTFSREDPTVFTSMMVDSDTESEPGSPPGKKIVTTANNFQIKASPKRASVAKDESVFVGSMITISPGSDMVFTLHTTAQQKEAVYQCVLVLTNPRTSLRTAYKVKTTTPERYKVRPSLGLIKPGQSTDVSVYVIGNRDDVVKDKFMVMAMEVEDGLLSSGELAELWKTANKSKISEHRLRCLLTVPPLAQLETKMDNTNTKFADVELHLTEINKKLDSVLESNKELKNQVQRLNRAQKVMMILLFCFAVLIMLTTYHRVSNIQYFARNKSSPFDCLLHQ